MARPKEKETVMTKQGKRTYRLRKDGKKNTGRPTKFTEDVIKKLEELVSNDVDITKACKFVGVSYQAYSDECKRNADFAEKMEKAQEFVGVLADRTIARAIKDGDTSTARWYKERRDERYKQKPPQINMNQGIDPETGEVSQGLIIDFTLEE